MVDAYSRRSLTALAGHVQPPGGAMNVAIENQLEKKDLRLEVNISTTLNVSAQQAKRRLTRYLMDNMSMFLHPEDPLLVIIDEQQIHWRFPVVLSMGRHGRLGQVGTLDVDAHTEQIIVSESLIEGIKANAERLARAASLAAVE
jgi:hypothetical protein